MIVQGETGKQVRLEDWGKRTVHLTAEHLLVLD